MNHDLILSLEQLMPDMLFILADDYGVEPNTVYCLVTPISTMKVGRAEETFKRQASELQRVSQTNLHTITLRFFGDIRSTARESAETMQLLLSSFKARSIFYMANMSIQNLNEIQTISVMRDTKRFEAHVITLTILSQSYIEFEDDVIETIHIEGELNDIQLEIDI